MADSRKMRLARAYVPFQQYTRRFEPFDGLMRGTIFPELYLPYRLVGQEHYYPVRWS